MKEKSNKKKKEKKEEKRGHPPFEKERGTEDPRAKR